jgi:uncharacterized protein YecT (DUF1311 family)
VNSASVITRHLLLAGYWSVVFSVGAFAQSMNAAGGPCAIAGSTAATVECFDNAFKAADRDLNALYRHIQKVLRPDESKALVQAERLWLQYRDATCEAEYELYGGGTGGPATRLACLESETRSRETSLMRSYEWRLEKFGSMSRASPSPTSEPAHGNATSDSEFIAEQLRMCPSWFDIPPQETDRRREITSIYLRLAQYPTDVIRIGVLLYVGNIAALDPRYMEAGLKVFALERVVFKVPTRLRVGEPFPYAVLGNPTKQEGAAKYIDFLWPYSVDTAGQLVLSGGAVALSIPPYNPLTDFTEMEMRLERRFPNAPSAPQPH